MLFALVLVAFGQLSTLRPAQEIWIYSKQKKQKNKKKNK
jgi:hypothetical protein